MTTLVNSMTPNGNTNQAIGLQLGWQSLVGGGPFPAPPVMDPNYQYSQVIILLTDGLNTQDRWYSNQTSIDTRQADDLRQRQGRRHHALYGAGQHRRRSNVHACCRIAQATPSKFFLLTSSTQIVGTFQQIGTALSNLRVAK